MNAILFMKIMPAGFNVSKETFMIVEFHMIKEERQRLIKIFIEGPLQKYLTGDISYGKFIEVTNEMCGTNFFYSDLYPSYLFNSSLVHHPVDEMIEDLKK